jgi:hypothetical protein
VIILTATQEDCLRDMLRDATEHVRATCLDAPAPAACDDCLSLIQAYRDLAGDLGLHSSATVTNRKAGT